MTPPDVDPPDVSIRELETRWGISRNGLKARARALGVDLVRLSSTATVWPGPFVELGERLNEHLAAGQPMATFPGLKPVVSAAPVPSVTAAPAAPALANQPELEQLAAAIRPAADPLQRARGLAEAADAGLVLANDDLAALLGHGVMAWRDRHQAYGYVFHRHQQGRQVLWTVERTIGRPAVTDGTGAALTAASAPAPASRRPGFVVDAKATVLSRLELPRWLPAALSAAC